MANPVIDEDGFRPAPDERWILVQDARTLVVLTVMVARKRIPPPASQAAVRRSVCRAGSWGHTGKREACYRELLFFRIRRF